MIFFSKTITTVCECQFKLGMLHTHKMTNDQSVLHNIKHEYCCWDR